MAKYSIVDGDVLVLTRAFNALREGSGTYIEPAATLEAFVAEWRGTARAFASEAGFIGIKDQASQGTVTLCQFAPGPVDTLFGADLKKLSAELLKALDLHVIRAVAMGERADRLLTLAGFTRDGLIRKLVADAAGVLQDMGMYSLTKEDLERPVMPEDPAVNEKKRRPKAEATLFAGNGEASDGAL